MHKTLLLALLMSCYLLHSQITFEKGYFITNSGQKIPCFIENLDWRNNPTSFIYKLNESDVDKKLETITNVSEFAIGNEKLYKRFTVQIERSQLATANLQKNKIPVFNSETIFLQSIVSGEANLYSYNDGNSNKFFFETSRMPIEQLVMIKYLDGDVIAFNQLFKQQLFNNTKCDKTPVNSFKNLEYNSKSLAKHFELYNSCTKGDAKETVNFLANEKKRASFSLRFTPGIYLAVATLTDPDDYYDASTNLKKTTIKFSLDAEFFLPFKKNTWSLFLNPGYEKFSPVKNYTSFVNNPGLFNDGDPVNYTAKTDYSVFELPIGIRRYVYFDKESRLFFDVAYVITLASKGATIEFRNKENLLNADVTLPVADKNNFAIGFGYAYKNLSAQVKYNTPRILTDYASWSAKYSSVGINVGYKIL